MSESVEVVAGFLKPFLGPLVGGLLYADSSIWTVIGFAGAGIFGSRFLLQWLHSERRKELVVPPYFWHLSFWGSSLNFLYAMHVDRAPLIIGSFFLPFLYARNLILLQRRGRGSVERLEARPKSLMPSADGSCEPRSRRAEESMLCASVDEAQR